MRIILLLHGKKKEPHAERNGMSPALSAVLLMPLSDSGFKTFSFLTAMTEAVLHIR